MSFSADILAAGRQALEETAKVVRIAAGNCCDNVIDKTPVLTGQLRSAWQGISGADDFTPDQVPDITDAGTTKKSVRESLARWDLSRPFFLYNQMPYGPRIEYDGWSGKAPQGMVRITAAKWPLFVLDAAREASGA